MSNPHKDLLDIVNAAERAKIARIHAASQPRVKALKEELSKIKETIQKRLDADLKKATSALKIDGTPHIGIEFIECGCEPRGYKDLTVRVEDLPILKRVHDQIAAIESKDAEQSSKISDQARLIRNAVVLHGRKNGNIEAVEKFAKD